MYRCYCKILKKLEKLEKEIQMNNMGDTTLAQAVQEIRKDLDQNIQEDAEQQSQINALDGNIDAAAASEESIDNLFNNP